MSTYVKRVSSAGSTPAQPNEFLSYKSIPVTGTESTAVSGVMANWGYYNTSFIPQWTRRRMWFFPRGNGKYSSGYNSGGGLVSKSNADTAGFIATYDLSEFAAASGYMPLAGSSAQLDVATLSAYIGQDDCIYMMGGSGQGPLWKIDSGSEYQSDVAPSLLATFGGTETSGTSISYGCPYMALQWVTDRNPTPIDYVSLAFLPWKMDLGGCYSMASVWHDGVHYLAMNIPAQGVVFMNTVPRDMTAGAYSSSIKEYTTYFSLGGGSDYTLTLAYTEPQAAEVKNQMIVQSAIDNEAYSHIAWVSGAVESVSGKKESVAYGLTAQGYAYQTSKVTLYKTKWSDSRRWYIDWEYAMYTTNEGGIEYGWRWRLLHGNLYTIRGQATTLSNETQSTSVWHGIWNAQLGGFDVVTVGSLEADAVDSSWTAFSSGTDVSYPLYDEYDGNIIFSVQGTDGSTEGCYLVKVSSVDGSLVWKRKINCYPYAIHPYSRVKGKRGLFVAYEDRVYKGSYSLHIIDTSTGLDEYVFSIPYYIGYTPQAPGFLTDAESGILIGYMPGASSIINGRWISALSLGFLSAGATGSPYYTTGNGSTYTEHNPDIPGALDGAWSGSLGKVCVVSAYNSNLLSATSSDLSEWTVGTVLAVGSLSSSLHVAWSPSLAKFCVRGYNFCATSADGLTWAAGSVSDDFSPTSLVWSSSLGKFCCAGQGSISTSSDGETWETSTATANANQVCWSDTLGMFCLTAGTKIYTSTDGSTWTQRWSDSNISSLYGVTYGAGKFCVVGDTVALTSSDGVAWASATPPVALSQVWYLDGGAVFQATSWSDGSLYSSADGLTWEVAATQPTPLTPATSSDTLPAWVMLRTQASTTVVSGQAYNYSANFVFGHSYKSRGQLLRALAPQESGAQNGPALAKTRRSHQLGALVSNAGDTVYVGADYRNLSPFPRRDFPGATAYGPTQLYSGVAWTAVDDAYTFNGELGWEVRRAYPLTVNAFGAFMHTQDR